MDLKEKIKNYTTYIVDDRANNWEVIELSDLQDLLDTDRAEQSKLHVVGVTLPTEEQLASDMDEICFRGSINQSAANKRQFLESGFMLGYNYLLNKINGCINPKKKEVKVINFKTRLEKKSKKELINWILKNTKSF